MGDVETLIEKAEAVFEEEEAAEAASRMLDGVFTLDDFLDMMRQVQKMGPLKSLMAMVPGMGREMSDMEIDESMLNRVRGIIHSMTPQERATPDIIDASRRQRIAAGSGCASSDVKRLIVQFKQMRTIMKSITGSEDGGRGGRRSRKAKRGRGGSRAGGVQPGGRGRGGPGRSRGRRGKGRRGGGRVTPKGTVVPSGAPLGNLPPLMPPGLDGLDLDGLDLDDRGSFRGGLPGF